MPYLDNTTETLRHLAYLVPGAEGRETVQYFTVPPGGRACSVEEAEVLIHHKPNQIFFDAGDIALLEKLPEQRDRAPGPDDKILKPVDPAAIAAMMKTKKTPARKDA